MKKYALGVDYGTLSARGILIDIQTGEEIACSTSDYKHAVMDITLPNGTKLKPDWALQDPSDYMEAFVAISKEILENADIEAEEISGIGIDFTACTILPIKNDGTPICSLAKYKDNPHAYVKLWKHHAAQKYADILNRKAEETNQSWLQFYGGKISSEWMVPKVMQIAEEAPEVYDEADKIIEAGDWLVMQLTGKEARSACFAGYKALWNYEDSYPDNEFFKMLSPKLDGFAKKKLSDKIFPLGSKAGEITEEIERLTGIKKGTSVAVAIIDAHAAMPACKISKPNKLLMIMGTSTCHLILTEKKAGVPGTCGIVKDGIIPGYYAIEAGQSCVGDHFSWFVDNCVPSPYIDEAKSKNISIHQLLVEKCEKQKPGENGLIALDWWNGVRSVLMDFDLTGVIVGLNLLTKPEDIYRALIEATAYGTKNIIDNFEKHGVVIDEIIASGGISTKNAFAMQVYSDICGKEILIANSKQAGAVGSAIYGAAANIEQTGYSDIHDLINKIGSLSDIKYTPNEKHTEIYSQLYSMYCEMTEYFGINSKIMKKLKKIKGGE